LTVMQDLMEVVTIWGVTSSDSENTGVVNEYEMGSFRSLQWFRFRRFS
jgi:hypothetical protein